MASSGHLFDLRRLWESYVRAPQENRTKKVAYLERFLKGLLSVAASMGYEEHDQATPSFANFSDMKSVSNILAGEFLVDVQHICSTSDDDDVTQLQEYLLRGRGAILLKVLNTIGVQGLSSARELGDLLVSLLPLCCRFTATHDQNIQDVKLTNIENCYEHLNHVPITQPPPKYPTVAEVKPKLKQHKLVVSSYQHPNWANRAQHVNQPVVESSDSDSESENTQQIWPHHGLDALYPLDPGFRLGVYPGLLQEQLSSNEEPDDDTDPLGENVYLEPIELTVLLLNLSKNLCYREGIGGPQGMAVSLALLPHLSHFLLALQTDHGQGNIPEGWNTNTVSYLERYTVRVILTVASFASLQPNGISSLAASGAVISLLEVAKQNLRTASEKGLPESITVSSPLLIANDILHGIWLLLHTIFYCIPLNPTFLNSSLKLLSEVVDNQGLRLLQTALLTWEKHHLKQNETHNEALLSKTHMVSLVESVGRVITSLKRAKINYIHTMRCMKKRHKTCDFKHYMHHHHDVLGIASSAMTDSQVAMNDSYGSMEALEPETVNPIECSVAILADLLLKVFRDAKSRILQVRTLCCVEESGLCCCMQPARIMRFLLKPIDTQTPGIRNYTLCVLAKSLLEYCGGSDAVQCHSLSCSICKDLPSASEDSALETSPRSQCNQTQETSDSALSSSDSMHDDVPSKHPKWRCLKQYLPLINHESEDISTQITQHILRLVSQGSVGLKQELFYSVFLPVMKLIKEQYRTKPNRLAVPSSDVSTEPAHITMSEGVVQYCLSALPLLLHSRSSQDLFLNYGGLKQLCQLVQTKVFRKCVLKVFQVLIMLEDKRKLKEGINKASSESFDQSSMDMDKMHDATDTTDSEPGQITDSGSGINVVEVFMKLLVNNPIYREPTVTSLPTEHYESTASITSASRQDSVGSSSTVTGIHSPDQFEESVSTLNGSIDTDSLSIGANFSPHTTEKVNISQDKNELAIMCDVWSACASLLPYSQSFQQSFLEADGPSIAYDLMLSCLHLICKTGKDLVDKQQKESVTSGVKKLALTSSEGVYLFEWLCLLESALVICLSCSKVTSTFEHSRLEMAAVLEKVQEVLTSSREVQGSVLKATCDTLLSCATTYRSMKDIIQNHTFAVMHLRIDDKDEVEVAELSDYCSTARDTETCHTELGYEADSEFTSDDMVNEKSSYVYRAGRSALQLMLYPQLCKLVLQLLVDHPTERPTSGVLSHILLKLISLAKQSAHIASAMYNQGLVEILLNGLRKIIRNYGSSPSSVVEQRLILDLFLLISQHAFSSRELKLFLALFQEENGPLDALLSTGIQLAECFKFQPACILAFPVFRSSVVTDLEFSVRSVSSDILTASIRPVSRLPSSETGDYNLKNSAVEAIDLEVTAASSDRASSIQGPSPTSPISCAPVQMLLRDKVLWPANSKGFSMSIWLRLEGLPDAEDGFLCRRNRKQVRTKTFGKTSHSDNSTNRSQMLPTKLKMALKKNLANRHWSQQCCHIASVGNVQEQFQLWADPNTASLLIRLIGKPQEGEELLGELCLPGLLSFENWHHLGITFSEQINGGTTMATIVAVSDGCYQKEGTIEHRSRAEMGEPTAESHVLLGQSIPSTTPQITVAPFQLGNLMLFQDAVLTKHTCFHLYALGPDCVTLSQCDSSDQRPGYAHHISHDALLNSGIAQEVLMGSHSIYLPKVRETMIVSYTPEHPTTYNLYNQSSSMKPQRNIFGGQKPARSSFEPLCHQPVNAGVRLLTDLTPQVHHGLSNAVGEIGGIGVYLFLLAKIVEQRGNEYQQAKALKLLFALKRQSPHHAEEFKAMNGYALLAKVFTSDRAIISMDLLKTMLDACLTRPLLRWDSIRQQYHLSTDVHPLIREVQIITDLLLAWRVWDRAPVGVWKTAFEALVLLVSGSHASCVFNVKQLQSAAIVNRLLLICLERIQEAYPCLPVPISQSIINIIQCVIGSRPEMHVVMTMCDFLLLMHPAASTYVHHELHHFYFIQNWESDSALSRHFQMSGSSYSTTGDYKLRHAATVVNITKDTGSNSPVHAAHSLPNLVKRSKSMPVGTSSPRKKRAEQFDELDTLLSDQEDSGEMTIRGRALTSPRTSPSSPRHSPKTSPKFSMKLSPRVSPGSSAASLSSVRVTPPDFSSKEVSPIDSPEQSEDTVDKSLVHLRSAVEAIPKRELENSENIYEEDTESGDDKDVARNDETSNSSGTLETTHLEDGVSKEDPPSRKLSQYETMAEYLEEITGAKHIPTDCIASTLSSQVREQIERRNSISEAGVQPATSKSSLNNISREALILENVEENINVSQPHLPEIEITAESPNKEHDVELLLNKVETLGITTEGNADEQVKPMVKRQQSMTSRSSCSSDWELYPNVDSMTSVPVNVHDSTGQTELDDDEKGLVLISAGLLELLSQIVVSLPSGDLLQVLGIILKPEVLLILAHHAAPEIRANTVKLLDMYIHRATVDHIESFIKQQGPQLLAAQLHRHSTCRDLVEACFTILFGKPHTLEDDIDTNLLSEMSKIQKLAVVPVFSLLESSVADTSLCHNSLMLLIQVFDRVPTMMQTMLDNGLQETLCNVLQAINAAPPRLSDLGCDERHLLIEDVQHFFTIIAEKTFSTSGVIYHQYLEDGLTLLHALEQQQIKVYGVNSEEVGNVRNIECHMFRGILDYVTTQLDTPTSRILPFTRAFGTKVKDSLLSLFSDTESESLASSNEDGDNQRRSPSPQPVIPSAETGLLAPLYEGSPMGIILPGFIGSKKADLTQGELQDRFKKMISAAVDFVLYTAPQSEVVETPQARRLASLIEDNAIEIVSFEHDFARFLIEFLVKGILAGMERSLFQRKTLNSTIMWQTKDVLRMQFSRLFTHMLHPHEVLHQRLFALDLVANEMKCRDLLKLTVHIGVTGQKLVQYLYELLSQHLNEINNPQRDEVDELMTILAGCGFQPLRLGTKLTNQQITGMEEEREFWDKEMLKERKIYFRRKEGARQRIYQKLENTAKKLSGAAMEVTQVVSHLQNQQRKKFTEHVKMEMTHRLQIKKTWQQLIQQLTHEKAVWHCCKSYPCSWQLDPTEGPSRIRKRLQRCHLGISSKFLKDKYKHKLDAEKYEPPLSFLFEEDASTSDSAALIYRLFTNEKIEFTCKCTSVTPSSETPGELLIGQTNVYFVGDEAIKDANYTQVLLGNKDLLSMTLPQEEIKELHKRWYQLCDNALEIFLTNGKTSLLAFSSTRERDQTYKLLDSLELPNVIRGENLTAIQNLWLEGKLTNFEYLTQLNKVAGRSFNDLMQYPVFPFVLSCYNEDYLNLDDKSIYRNLSRPIAVQHKDRERKYVENYKWLEYEKQKSFINGDPAEYRPEPYHYGSHYSNSGTVLHFLVRLPPFTQMFLDYQDQNFDLPDRTFHNVQTAWRLASYESTTDVKELIPEFFYLPEFLLNLEGFDFGVRQTGERVWNVSLPPWSRQNPRLFVLVHRQALESNYVTSDLGSWIDLVFGFRQQGKPAIDAVNVFHPATYFGVNVDSIEDPVRRNAMKTMIKTYGQTPKQLFKHQHPGKQAQQKRTSADASDQLQPMKEVTGLRWGNYVGSPAHSDPVLAWTQSYGSMVASVVSLPTGDVFGLGPCSTLLVMYSKETDAVRIHHTDVQWAAIVSWGHPDGIIRVKNKRNSPAINFMHWNSNEQVRCCASVPDCRLLFFGGTSGVLSVYHTKFNSSKASDIQIFGHRQCLYGHSEEITMMSVCKPFSILVTASMDGTAIIWDLNRLCYVRSIQDHSAGVHVLAISDTLGDIATASHTGQGSEMMVHTINGEKVGKMSCEELIHCLAYSNAPEGKSVNVLVAGLSTGVVRFWSSWDLLPVRDVVWGKFTRPIISLTFTHDAQRLYASNTEGTVVMWEKNSSSKSKPVNFIPFL